MARDYENLHDVSDLSDRELRELVEQQLAENDGVDADNVTVIVEGGLVRLTGRIGTEEELRVAERVVSDVLGITRYVNELVVDPNRRDEEPAGADDAAAEREPTPTRSSAGRRASTPSLRPSGGGRGRAALRHARRAGRDRTGRVVLASRPADAGRTWRHGGQAAGVRRGPS